MCCYHINAFKVKGLFIRMKVMNLFLVSVVLLLGFAGLAYAEVDNATDIGNQTVVILNESNVSVVLNETLLDEDEIIVEMNETLSGNEPLLANETEQVDVVIEDEEVVEDKESIFDGVISYVGGVVDKINEIHDNLFFMILIILGVLALFVYSLFFDCSSAKACFSKASSLHRKGEMAHVNGDYEKSKKLYGKSYLLRAKGEGIVSGGADGNAI